MTNDAQSSSKKLPLSSFRPALPLLGAASNSRTELQKAAALRERPPHLKELASSKGRVVTPSKALHSRLSTFSNHESRTAESLGPCKTEDLLNVKHFEGSSGTKPANSTCREHACLRRKRVDDIAAADQTARPFQDTPFCLKSNEQQKSDGPKVVMSTLGALLSGMEPIKKDCVQAAPQDRKIGSREQDFSHYDSLRRGSPNALPNKSATPISVRAKTLIREVSGASRSKNRLAATDNGTIADKGDDTYRSLSELAPKTTSLSDDWLYGEGGSSPTRWSPKKRKGGFIAVGQASRAWAILSSACTDHSLWLHSLSRRVSQHQSSPTPESRSKLAALLKPRMHLTVLEVFKPSSVGLMSAGDEHKALLASCRFILSCPMAEQDVIGLNRHDTTQIDGSEEHLEGLVYFSLHLHPPTSPTNLSHMSPSSHRRFDTEKRGVHKDSASLSVPIIPSDLRHIVKGAQLWIWDPYHQAKLPTVVESQNRALVSVVASETSATVSDADFYQTTPNGTLREPNLGDPMIENDDIWGTRPLPLRDQERDLKMRHEQAKEHAEVALICSRFAIVY